MLPAHKFRTFLLPNMTTSLDIQEQLSLCPTLSSTRWGMDRLGKACQEGRGLCPDRNNPAPLTRRRPDGLRQADATRSDSSKKICRRPGGPQSYKSETGPPSSPTVSARRRKTNRPLGQDATVKTGVCVGANACFLNRQNEFKCYQTRR